MQEAMVPWSSNKHSLRTGGCHRGKATVLPISTEGGERRCRLERSCLVQEVRARKPAGDNQSSIQPVDCPGPDAGSYGGGRRCLEYSTRLEWVVEDGD